MEGKDCYDKKFVLKITMSMTLSSMLGTEV